MLLYSYITHVIIFKYNPCHIQTLPMLLYWNITHVIIFKHCPCHYIQILPILLYSNITHFIIFKHCQCHYIQTLPILLYSNITHVIIFKYYPPSMLIKLQPDASVYRYLFTAKSLYMFRVSQHPSSGLLKTVTAATRTGHLYSYFPPTWPDQATLEGSSCTSIMTCTGGCGYSF
jgi:hypothetical protein